MKYNKIVMAGVILGFSASIMTSCATISEDGCLSASWQDEGYNDGRKGKSRGRFAKLSKTCGKYNVLPDRSAYMSGFDKGVQQFCTYRNGFSRGENGGSLNQECRAISADDYLRGHADGYERYEIIREHKGLVSSYEDTVLALVEVRRRLSEDEMDDSVRRRLWARSLRLEDRRESLRQDIRAFERRYGVPRYGF